MGGLQKVSINDDDAALPDHVRAACRFGVTTARQLPRTSGTFLDNDGTAPGATPIPEPAIVEVLDAKGDVTDMGVSKVYPNLALLGTPVPVP